MMGAGYESCEVDVCRCVRPVKKHCCSLWETNLYLKVLRTKSSSITSSQDWWSCLQAAVKM